MLNGLQQSAANAFPLPIMSTVKTVNVTVCRQLREADQLIVFFSNERIGFAQAFFLLGRFPLGWSPSFYLCLRVILAIHLMHGVI